MYRIVWEYEVKPQSLLQFESVYGLGGRWTEFFQRGEGYVGTELFRSTANQWRFVTIDTWRSRPAYESFRKTYAGEYAALDAWCEHLLTRERTVGVTDDGKD